MKMKSDFIQKGKFLHGGFRSQTITVWCPDTRRKSQILRLNAGNGPRQLTQVCFCEPGAADQTCVPPPEGQRPEVTRDVQLAVGVLLTEPARLAPQMLDESLCGRVTAFSSRTGKKISVYLPPEVGLR